VFLNIPTGAQYLVQNLIRLISGMGDFARMHAHHALRKKVELPFQLTSPLKKPQQECF
jgi:hypothetical protein